MMTNLNDTHIASPSSHRAGPLQCWTHPDEVLRDKNLGVVQKREILADWASDSHAVANLPAMRQLESGAIVSVDAVLTALQTLDDQDQAASVTRKQARLWDRKRLRFLPSWRRTDSDDDDDPPPCPAAALPPGVELELRRRREAEWRLAPAA